MDERGACGSKYFCLSASLTGTVILLLLTMMVVVFVEIRADHFEHSVSNLKAERILPCNVSLEKIYFSCVCRNS